VREVSIAPTTLLAGSTSGLVFSPDQRFLYVIDGANHHVWILLRETLEVVDRIGQQGIFGGALNVPHALAVDSKGNIYVGENFDGHRLETQTIPTTQEVLRRALRSRQANVH
jgi:sugar lactone lactonase YvrE